MKRLAIIGLSLAVITTGLVFVVGRNWGDSPESVAAPAPTPVPESDLEPSDFESFEPAEGEPADTKPSAQAKPADTDPTRVDALDFETTDVFAVADQSSYEAGDIHLKSSRVYIFVGKTGFGHEHGVEGKLESGNITLNGTASGKIVFDLKSFDADTPNARKYVGLKGTTDAGTRQKVNANMLGADVLNVAKYPTATFEVTAAYPMKQAGPGGSLQYRIDGKFTLHGTTQKVSVIANIETKGNWSHVRGRFAILQSDYGIKPFSKALGAIGVADKLTIYGDFWVARTKLVVRKRH